MTLVGNIFLKDRDCEETVDRIDLKFTGLITLVTARFVIVVISPY